MREDLHEYVLSSMEALSCPRALTLAILARYGEWEAIVTMDLNPALYAEPESYLRAAQAHAFLAKLPDIPMSGPDERRAAAIAKWRQGELECARSNARLTPYLYNGPFQSLSEIRIAEFFSDVKKLVKTTLGRPPTLIEGRFGPGSTVSDGYGSVVPDKISSVPTYTPHAWPWLVNWFSCGLGSVRAESGRPPARVRGNQFFTVPKNCKTDRACAKEPSINVYYQLGLGGAVRRRLSKVGLDLDHGQDLHRALAREGSLTGRWATIDLSNASDTVSKVLVKLLLPSDWYELFAQLRSPCTLLEGTWVNLQKFSSMGNGFTFELETLIFSHVASVAGGLTPGVDCFVYGDDIIVPSEKADDVLSALRFCGFTPNRTKTFTSGPFRESCGGDFYGGVAVRPFYPKVIPSEPAEVITHLNGIARVNSLIRVVHPRLWLRLHDSLPTAIRACKGPAQLGDVVIHVPSWHTRWKHSIGYVRCWKPVTRPKAFVWGFSEQTRLMSSLLGVIPDDDTQGYVGRGCVEGYRLGWVAFS